MTVCPNCKTSDQMSKKYPDPGRCMRCGWYFGGMPTGGVATGGVSTGPSMGVMVAGGGGCVGIAGVSTVMTACTLLQHCRLPAGGGACADCGYPKAYAHPGSIDAALTMNEAVFVNGTALVIVPDPQMSPSVLRVVTREPKGGFSSVDYQIPVAMPQPVLYDGLTAQQCLERYAAWQRLDSTRDKLLEYPTACQLAAARELWAAQLRSRVQATSKPKLTVMVQVDCDE